MPVIGILSTHAGNGKHVQPTASENATKNKKENVQTGEFEMAIASLQIKLPVFLSVTS